MKNIYLLALLCFSIDGYSLSKEYICTYKGTFQSNPYDKKTYVERNPKLLDLLRLLAPEKEIFNLHDG